MDLSESEESQDSQDFRVELVDTSDPDNKGNFRLSWNVNLSSKLCLSSCCNFSLVGSLILSLMLLSFLEYLLSS